MGIKTDLFGTLWPPQVRPARPAHHRRTRGRILGQLGSPVDALRRASTSKLHRKLRRVEVQCGSEGRRRAGETVALRRLLAAWPRECHGALIHAPGASRMAREGRSWSPRRRERPGLGSRAVGDDKIIELMEIHVN